MAGPSRASQSHIIQESFVHIIHPVAVQALKSIIRRVGFADFFNAYEVRSDFSSPQKATDANHNATLLDNRCTAKLNPNVNPTTNKWEGNGTTVDLGNGNSLVSNHNGSYTAKLPWIKNLVADRNAAILYDSDFNISLTEMSVGATLSMEVACEFKYSVQATEFLSRLFQCLTNGDMIGYVDVQYDYPVPMPIQHTLNYLYGLRGKRSDDDTVMKWVSDCSEQAITILANRNAMERQEVVVNKNQFQAVYLVECSQEFPQPMGTEGASVNFTLTVQYARANRLVLQYPIIVNNQFVDFDYIPTNPEFRQGLPSPIMWQNLAYTKYWQQIYLSKGTNVVHYPWWDEWMVPNDSQAWRRGQRPIAIIAFTLDDIDNESGETTIDLIKGLPGFRLSDDLIAEIKYKRNTILDPMDYANVTVYADDAMVGHHEFVDGYKPFVDLSDGRHLIVRSRRKNAVYHLVISVNESPINRTSRPLAYQVYPSRWLDVTMPTYVQTKDGVVVSGSSYFYYNDTLKQYVAIPATVATVGRDMDEIRALYSVNVIFVQEPPLSDTSMAAKFETVETSTEPEIKIEEDRIGTPSGQVYCYKQPNLSASGQWTLGASDATPTYIDLASVCAAIHEKYPSKDTIYLSDVRTELELPTSVAIDEELAPALTEPIETMSSKIQDYIDSYKGRNVAHVEVVTFHTGGHKNK